MKITKLHKKFYINNKVKLNSQLWGEEEKVSIHTLINSQVKAKHHSLTNTSKQSFCRKVSRTKSSKTKLVTKYYLHSLQDKDHQPLTSFYLKLLNKLRGFMLYKDIRTNKIYKVEDKRVYVDLGCGWFKSDYSFTEFNKLIKQGEIVPSV